MNFSDFSTPEKEFCCLKMKEVIQAQIYEEIKDMTDEEVLAYYKRPTTIGPFKPYYLPKKREIAMLEKENTMIHN